MTPPAGGQVGAKLYVRAAADFGVLPRTAGVGGNRCERCHFDTLSRCLRCDADVCGDCLGRHECEAS